MVRLRSASWVLASQVASLLISFPMSILLARTLGAGGKGQVALAQLIPGIGAVVVTLGLPAAALYLVAQRRVGFRGVFIISTVLAFIATAAAAIAWLVMRDYLRIHAGASSDLIVFLGILALGPVVVSSFMASTLSGLGRLRQVSLVNVSLLALQMIIYCVLWLAGLLTPLSAVASWLAVTTVVAVTLSVMAYRGTEDVESDTPSSFLKAGLSYGLLSWIAGGLGILVLRIDMLLLGTFKGAAAVGIYSVAVTFAELLFYLPNAVNAVLVPKVASDHEGAVELTARLTRVIWPLTLVSGVALGLAASAAVPLLYGPEFHSSVLAFWVLVPGTAMSAIAGGITGYFAGTGRPRETVVANSLNLVANVALNLVLIPRLGVLGASLSSAASYTVGALVLVGRFSSLEQTRLRDILRPRTADFREFSSTIGAAVRQRLASGPVDEVV